MTCATATYISDLREQYLTGSFDSQVTADRQRLLTLAAPLLAAVNPQTRENITNELYLDAHIRIQEQFEDAA